MSRIRKSTAGRLLTRMPGATRTPKREPAELLVGSRARAREVPAVLPEARLVQVVLLVAWLGLEPEVLAELVSAEPELVDPEEQGRPAEPVGQAIPAMMVRNVLRTGSLWGLSASIRRWMTEHPVPAASVRMACVSPSPGPAAAVLVGLPGREERGVLLELAVLVALAVVEGIAVG